MPCLPLHQWLTHVTGRSVSGCVCSAPVDRCVPARTTTWPTMAHAWRDKPLPSPHSVSPQILSLYWCTHTDCIPHLHFMKLQGGFNIGNFRFRCRAQNIDSLWNSSCTAPPSGPCDIQCQNGGSCFLNARQVAKCRCQPSYTGERCEINQCRDYCKNGGTCTASHTGKGTALGHNHSFTTH